MNFQVTMPVAVSRPGIDADQDVHAGAEVDVGREALEARAAASTSLSANEIGPEAERVEVVRRRVELVGDRHLEGVGADAVATFSKLTV